MKLRLFIEILAFPNTLNLRLHLQSRLEALKNEKKANDNEDKKLNHPFEKIKIRRSSQLSNID